MLLKDRLGPAGDVHYMLRVELIFIQRAFLADRRMGLDRTQKLFTHFFVVRKVNDLQALNDFGGSTVFGSPKSHHPEMVNLFQIWPQFDISLIIPLPNLSLGSSHRIKQCKSSQITNKIKVYFLNIPISQFKNVM